MIILFTDEIIIGIKERIKKNNNHYKGCIETRDSKDFTTLSLSGIAVFRFNSDSNEILLEVSNKYLGLLEIDNNFQIIKDSAQWSTLVCNNKVKEHIFKKINKIFNQCYTDSATDMFGCCSRYLECSDAKYCIYPDKKDARGCMYKVNLDNGKIFYGENRNID